ncbi:MAG TPA: alpha/beta fold hydrolase [Terriglobia bacterium]|nr:alpha/beta fold hydrolase [Terriglobia bacterium]
MPNMTDTVSAGASSTPRRFWIALFIAIFAGSSGAYSQTESRRDTGVFQVDPPTPYVHYSPVGQSRGRVLVVHGLDASKELMNLFSQSLVDAGFEVYAIDLPGHGDSTVPFNGIVARNAVAAVLDTLTEPVIVAGHSMGAALLLDLANERDFSNMVLLSPAPTPVNRIRAQRALIIAGQFDIPRIRAFASELETAGEGEVRVQIAPWTGHTGAVFHPSLQKEIAEWLGGDVESIRSGWRLTLLAGMIISALLLGVALLSSGPVPEFGEHARAAPAIARYAMAGVFATLACAAAPPLFSWVRLFATDYVVGFALLAGIALLVMRGRPARPPGTPFLEASAIALLAAVYVIVAPGLWAGGNALHLAPQEPRWWRLPLIAAALLPLLISDEIHIRPIRPWWKAAAIALATRLMLAAFLVTGALTFNRGSAFVVVVMHLIVALWMVLWFAGEFIYRRTQNPLATALFAAIVQAWIFAAVFVTQ